MTCPFVNTRRMICAFVTSCRSGLGGVELFSMGLKASGTYLSRTLSYKDAEFRLEQIKIDPAFRVMYNRSTMLWSLLHNVLKHMPKKGRGRDARQGLFWSAHQRFYKCMLMASKVRRCSELAIQALKDGMCVVIGLQSTGGECVITYILLTRLLSALGHLHSVSCIS